MFGVFSGTVKANKNYYGLKKILQKQVLGMESFKSVHDRIKVFKII